jgi:hypothetical protein
MEEYMELIQTSIGQLLSILSENFWQIFMIISMLSIKKYRTPAIILLLFQIMFGYKWYIYLAAVVLALCIDCAIDTANQKIINKLENLERHLKDPDYR